MTEHVLRAALVAFDDAALATLANAGLVRRARRDVEEGKVRLVEETAAEATLEADGHAVSIDARGPNSAICACKSVALCRHRIAAVLFLQASLGDQDAVEPAIEEEGDPREIVASMDLSALERWTGKAGWLAAMELVGTAGEVNVGRNAIAVSFPDLEGPVRILRGQGFGGIVSKASKARLKAFHGAAVLAALRHFGAELPVVREDDDEAATRALEVDPAFLERIRACLGEVAMFGLNLAPLPLEESLFELSVSSRADSLPRLAALLRSIAAQIRMRRLRALDFDPDRLLELAATAYALLQALQGSDDERRLALAGKVRRDFSPAEPLHLVGCGGERWRTTIGARGVTAWFIEPETGRWLSTSLARGPGQDPAFMPGEAWRSQSLWQAGPLSELAHARIDLAGTRRSTDNRLSAPASAKASIVQKFVRPDPDWPGIVRDWSDLQRNWLDQTGLGLDAPVTPAACLIEPDDIAAPWFDDLAQQIVWPVRDMRGQWLALTLNHDDQVTTAVEALEATVRGGWQGMVLVRLVRTGDRLEVRPITIFDKDGAVDLTLWQPPYRRQARNVTHVRDWLGRLRPRAGRPFARAPRETTQAALADAWRNLVDRAEVGPSLAGSLDDRLEAEAARLDSFGMPNVAKRLRRASDREGLLAAAYALLLARQQRCSAPLLQ